MSGHRPEPLLTPGEVAALFRVDPKTVTRWAAVGKLSAIRTPGGHARFRESEIRALLETEEERVERELRGTVVVELPGAGDRGPR